jgi:uncharacterized protein YqgV (UPF0045/DUF77 family)
MLLAAQISIYPLRQLNLSPAIEQAVTVFKNHGLEVSEGTMSSIVMGEDEILFTALKEGFRQAAKDSEVVMTLTISNACPVTR